MLWNTFIAAIVVAGLLACATTAQAAVPPRQPIYSTLQQGGKYYIQLLFGTAQQPQRLVLDTGSAALAFSWQQQCTNCPTTCDSFWSSASATPLPCANLCTGFCTSGSFPAQCGQSVSYSGGTGWQGALFNDTCNVPGTSAQFTATFAAMYVRRTSLGSNPDLDGIVGVRNAVTNKVGSNTGPGPAFANFPVQITSSLGLPPMFTLCFAQQFGGTVTWGTLDTTANSTAYTAWSLVTEGLVDSNGYLGPGAVYATVVQVGVGGITGTAQTAAVTETAPAIVIDSGTETLNLSPSAYQAFVGILASQSASLPGCTPQTCSATNFNPSLLTYSQVSAWPVISITLASTGTSGPAQPVTYQVAPISYFFPSKAAIEAASGTLGSLLTSSTAPVWMFYIKQSSSTFSLLGVPFVQGRAIAIAQAEGLEYIATSSASCGGVSTSGLAALTSMPVPDPVCSWGQQIVTTTVSRPNGGVTTTKPSEAYLGMGRGGALMAGIVFAIVSLVFC